MKGKSLSRVWLWVTPWTAALQAPPSMGFSRQEYWSGVTLPSPLISLSPHDSSSLLLLMDVTDNLKWNVLLFVVYPLSHFWLFCNLMDCSLPDSSVHGISQARKLEGFPSPGDLPNLVMKSASPAFKGDSLPLIHQGNPYKSIGMAKIQNTDTSKCSQVCKMWTKRNSCSLLVGLQNTATLKRVG